MHTELQREICSSSFRGLPLDKCMCKLCKVHNICSSCSCRRICIARMHGNLPVSEISRYTKVQHLPLVAGRAFSCEWHLVHGRERSGGSQDRGRRWMSPLGVARVPATIYKRRHELTFPAAMSDRPSWCQRWNSLNENFMARSRHCEETRRHTNMLELCNRVRVVGVRIRAGGPGLR